MDRRVQIEALVGPSGHHRHQQQMAGGGDRQEFGDALNDGQDEELEECQSMPPLPPRADSLLRAGAL